MKRDRVASIVEVRRMPAGDRGPRLRALAEHYRARLAAAQSGPPPTRQRGRVTAYHAALAQFERLQSAMLCA